MMKFLYFLIDIDVFCSMILFFFVDDDNALIVQDRLFFWLNKKNISHID